MNLLIIINNLYRGYLYIPVGTDWHRKLYLTLRHAAGCDEAMRK